MTAIWRCDAIIAAWLADGPRDLSAEERSAVADAAGLVRQRQPGFLRRPSSRWSVAGSGLAAVAVIVAVAVLLGSWWSGPSIGGQSATAPTPAPSSVPSPASTVSPRRSPAAVACVDEAPVVVIAWSGPVRADAAAMPTLCTQVDPGVFNGLPFHDDPVDATFEGIDIVRIGGWASWWRFDLAGRVPCCVDADPARGVYEHGIAVDIDDDEIPDYLFAITNDPPVAPHLRVWMTNLKSGVTVEQVGPPYGVPFDFVHPNDPSTDGLSGTSSMSFFTNAAWWDIGPGPVTTSAPAASPLAVSAIRFYAWATMTRDSEPFAWDYAPDFGWLSAIP